MPKPGALLMGYPVNDFAEIKPVYHAVMDPASCRWRYYWSDISGGITPDFPPTYFWYGKNDVSLKTLDIRSRVGRPEGVGGKRCAL